MAIEYSEAVNATLAYAPGPRGLLLLSLSNRRR